MPAHLYTTRQSLVEAGGGVSSWDDARINRLIRAVSAAVDRVTGLRFIAYEETIALDGNETGRIGRADRLPILAVSSVAVDANRSGRRSRAFTADLAPGYGSASYVSSYIGQADTAVFDPTSADYVLSPSVLPRTIELPLGLWPGGFGNVGVTGVFGWLDPSSVRSAPFASTLGADFTPTSNVLTLATTTGLVPRDVVVLGAGAGLVAVIVNAILTSTTVSVDPPTGIMGATISSGALARSWGAVPPDIEEAVNILAKRKKVRDAASEAGASVDPSLLRRLETDGGKTEYYAPGGATGAAATTRFGIPEVDEILAYYRDECGRAAG